MPRKKTTDQFIEEAHRSVHDALMVVKRTVASSTVGFVIRR